MGISIYKNIFAKDYIASWSEKVFVIKKVKYTVPCTYLIEDLNGEETKKLLELFTKQELQKINQRKSKIEKIIKRKINKLYGK